MKYNFFDIEVQEFEAEHGERLKKEWIEDSKGFSSYRDYVVNSFLNETWNNLSEDQKTEIALKAHGNDTPMK